MKGHLTPRQREVLESIMAFSRQMGYPPTVRELGKILGLRSPSTVAGHLATLERKGYLRRSIPSAPRTLVVIEEELREERRCGR